MMQRSRLISLLALFNLAAGGVLESWLADLRVSVPKGTVPPLEVDVKIVLATVHVKVTLDALVCEGFQGQLASTPITSQGVVSVSTPSVTVFCEGQVDYWTSLGLKGVASATLQTSSASAQLAMTTPSWSLENRSAPTVDVASCQASPNLELKITSGSFWTQFAEYLPGVIKKIQTLTNDKIAEYLCQSLLPKGQQQLEAWMTRRLADARTWNISYPPALESTWVDWAEHTLSQGILQFQQQFLEPQGVYDWLIGQRCMVGADTVCFTDAICLLGNLSLDPTTQRNDACSPSNGSFGVALPELRWNISQFLVSPLMLQNASIAANLSATRFQMRPVINISYQPNDSAIQGDLESRVAEAVFTNVTLREVKLAANITAGVKQENLSKVPSFQYFESKCIGPCTEELTLNSMFASFQLEHVVFSSKENATLLTSLLKLSNEILSPPSGLQNFSAVLIEGAFRNQFAQQINQSMAQWLSRYQPETCPRPKGEGRQYPSGQILIRPAFGKLCCWIALATFLLALLLGVLLKRGARSYSHWFAGALCQCDSVPRSLAVMLPVTILACLCFLLGSNYLLMAQTFVNLEQAPSFVWNAFQVMVYSLFYSIDALYYDADLKAMSWVVLCFSAILPYVKLILMLVSWLTPKQILPLRLRSWIVVLMDDIGKFSLVDVFTVQFLSGVFHIEVAGAAAAGVAVEPLRVVLRTNEELGFAAFVFATVVSLLIGHLCRHYHQKSVKRSSHASCELRGAGDVELQEQVISLEMPLSGAGTPPRRGWQELLVGPTLLITLILCIVGCFLPAFSVNLRTVFGALGSSKFSLFQFAYSLPSFAEHPRSFASLFNQVTFMVFALGVNFLQLLLLLLLWYQLVPRRINRRVNVSAVVHCLGAWAAMDVALISMIVTMVELKQSDFVHLAGGQKEQLSRLSGIDVRGGDKGLSVDVVLGSGTYVLFAAVLLHAWITRAALNHRT